MHAREWSKAKIKWNARLRRSRPAIIWLTACCIVTFTLVLFASLSKSHTSEGRIYRREKTHQRTSKNHSPSSDKPGKHGKSGRGQKGASQRMRPPTIFPSAEGSIKDQSDYSATSYPLSTPNGYYELIDKSYNLPELVYIPFEDAVADDVLDGWEAEWISTGTYNVEKWGKLKEPLVDFVYTWVNGSQQDFLQTMRPYELNSNLNLQDDDRWLNRHSSNRYRDWNEFKYSIRSVEDFAPFRNKIQVLVNSLDYGEDSKQIPSWLNRDVMGDVFQVLSQEDFFEADKQVCLPTFNSITIEGQLHNTKSDVDRVFALSDDMLLGRPHAASDIYSPLFGPLIAFKTNSYNTAHPPTEADAQKFGEKPWLIYTSWMLNRRFGTRKRKGQVHHGHSLSRKVTREAMNSFPGPELQSACSRFRGDFGFQLYPWFAAFHYSIERHREALLWSYLVHRSDPDGDGYLSWAERQQINDDLEEGLRNEVSTSYRIRNYYHIAEILEAAGLEPPKVNFDILWTSMDGPYTGKDADCFSFDVNECLAPGFSAPGSDKSPRSPVFSTTAILDRVARQQPECGDCLIKILLNRVQKGLEPMLPNNETQPADFETVIKALMRYQYVITESDGLFVMVTDAEQVETTLIKRLLTKKIQVGQLCLNDDVSTEDEEELADLYDTIHTLFEGMYPRPSRFERAPDD